MSIQTAGLLRPNTWYDGTLYHLYHPTECNPNDAQYQRNIGVCKEFEAVVGDPDGIRHLMDKHKDLYSVDGSN